MFEISFLYFLFSGRCEAFLENSIDYACFMRSSVAVDKYISWSTFNAIYYFNYLFVYLLSGCLVKLYIKVKCLYLSDAFVFFKDIDIFRNVVRL